MRCLECGSEAVTERSERTVQGYPRFRCRACGKQFNERSDTLLNRTQYPSDVIALVVLWRVRYKLSPRDLPEMFAVRGRDGTSYRRSSSNARRRALSVKAEQGASSGDPKGNGSGLERGLRAVLGVEQRLPLQQNAGHPEQPVGDPAQSTPIGVATRP